MAGNTVITDTYDRVFTSTRTHIIPRLFDNITKDIPTMYYFSEQGRIERGVTGAALEFIVLKELPAGTGAAATQKVTPVYIDPATRGRYVFKNLYVPIKMAGQDMAKNVGEEAVVSFVAMHVEAMLASMTDLLGGSVRGAWDTGVDETDETLLTGIASMVKATGIASGTTGNISRTNTWWQNQLGTAITSFATNGISGWRSAMFLAKRMNEMPDVLITNNTQYQNYLAALTNTLRMNLPIDARVADRTTADVGLSEVSFYGMRIIGDSQATANLAFFLNTRKYFKYYTLEGRDMFMREPVLVIDEDAVALMLSHMSNFVCTNLARQAVVSGGDTA